jgi:hypothetical protein
MTTHCGQNSTLDPQLSMPGVGPVDMWVLDARHCCNGLVSGGMPLEVLTFFTDTPRALAAAPDGSKVYVTSFFSGNGRHRLSGA